MQTYSTGSGFLAVFWLLLASVFADAQNLLQNPTAERGATTHWRTSGSATAEQYPGGDWCFVVRYGGSFSQDVMLPEDKAGKYALLIGRVASERINSDGAITGLPYLYGYMLEGNGRRGKINAYLQSSTMRSQAAKENEWATVWGISQVPLDTGAIRFFLNQAERKGVPHNGSAARFTKLGLYIFPSEQEAKDFLKTFNDQH